MAAMRNVHKNPGDNRKAGRIPSNKRARLRRVYFFGIGERHWKFTRVTTRLRGQTERVASRLHGNAVDIHRQYLAEENADEPKTQLDSANFRVRARVLFVRVVGLSIGGSLMED